MGNNSVNKPNSAKHRSSKSHSHSKMKKERGVIPYITNSLIYVLISLVIILPLFIGFVNKSVDAVHNVQNSLTADFYDYEVYSERFDNKTLSYSEGKIGICEKVGVLKCESVGINQNVYFGINRVSLRNGVGLSTESKFGESDSKLILAGYSIGALKGLSNIQEGDTVSFETTDKIYEYTVLSNVLGEYSEDDNANLVVSCDDKNYAFSAMGKDNRYVSCALSAVKNKKGA
ncbi:MAG: hypothetical protein IKI34_00665 [Eubacterium sp.]|nr:hypothetical protein [Eubacterium sp.]